MDRLHSRRPDPRRVRSNLAAAGFEDIQIEATHRVHDQAESAIIRATLPA